MNAVVHPPKVLHPRDEHDVAEIVAHSERPLAPTGGGSKQAVGRPVSADILHLSALSGVVDYEPGEMVLTVRAGTPLREVERLLAAERQRLAFEPPDFGALLGTSVPQTIGGVVSANQSGSRRVVAGAARDHFLGFHGVTGRGEQFKAGGRVVKNVTGYDLPKLIAGSWGTLAVLTELTLRVVPMAEYERTVIVPASNLDAAMALLLQVMGTPYDVSCAAFDPKRGVMLRLEGFPASVEARCTELLRDLKITNPELVEGDASQVLWSRVGGVVSLAESPVVWRVSVPPTNASAVIRALEPQQYLVDWGGGLIWMGFAEADAERVRSVVTQGHATLFKAPESVRATVPVFHPLPSQLGALTSRVKAAFDPADKLNPGRMS